jgi:micrococcal nuclease
MKKLLLVILTSVVVCATVVAQAGKIVKIIDGDTFDLQTEASVIRVRIWGIDAPEKLQDYGLISSKWLSLQLSDTCHIVVCSKDRYGRAIARVYIGSRDIGLESVKCGMAWVYTAYTKDRQYQAAMGKARFLKAGLWSQQSPIAPWLFRKNNSKK